MDCIHRLNVSLRIYDGVLATGPVNVIPWKLGVCQCKQATMKLVNKMDTVPMTTALFIGRNTHAFIHAIEETQGDH